jgi:hypothetical protein
VAYLFPAFSFDRTIVLNASSNDFPLSSASRLFPAAPKRRATIYGPAKAL